MRVIYLLGLLGRIIGEFSVWLFERQQQQQR